MQYIITSKARAFTDFDIETEVQTTLEEFENEAIINGATDFKMFDSRMNSDHKIIQFHLENMFVTAKAVPVK